MATRKPPKKSPGKTSAVKSSKRKAAKTPNKIANRASKATVVKSRPKQTRSAKIAKPDDQKTGIRVLGEIVWLMSQSKTHQNVSVGEFNVRLLPAIEKGQVRVFQAKNKLIGAAVWALVSDEVEKRMAQGNPNLEPKDWNSGNTVWLIDLIAPFGAAQSMLDEMKETLFSDHVIKFRGVKDGKAKIYTI